MIRTPDANKKIKLGRVSSVHKRTPSSYCFAIYLCFCLPGGNIPLAWYRIRLSGTGAVLAMVQKVTWLSQKELKFVVD